MLVFFLNIKVFLFYNIKMYKDNENRKCDYLFMYCLLIDKYMLIGLLLFYNVFYIRFWLVSFLSIVGYNLRYENDI